MLNPSCHAPASSSTGRPSKVPRRSRLPPVLPSIDAGTPAASADSNTSDACLGSRVTTMRDGASPNNAASHRDGTPFVNSSDATNPTDPAPPIRPSPRIQDSASATTNPPSEQSWADMANPSAIRFRQNPCTRRSSARSILGRPLTRRWIAFRYSLPARSDARAVSWPAPSSTTASPSPGNPAPQCCLTSDNRPRPPTMGVGNMAVPWLSLYRLTLPLTTGTPNARHARAMPRIDCSSW